jgi:hypothetical protein
MPHHQNPGKIHNVKAANINPSQMWQSSDRLFGDDLINNRKFWKELICLLALYCLKMSFALKPADMTLHKITEFYTELFSVYHNTT